MNPSSRAAVAGPVFLLSSFITPAVSHLPFSLFRQIAILQTGFNLVVGLLAVPLLGPITRAVHYLIAPQPGDESPRKQEFLDEKALDSPPLALAQATRQTPNALNGRPDRYHSGPVLDRGDNSNTDLAKRLQLQVDKVDVFNTSISDYLSRIREGMSQEDTQWQFTLLAFSNELESVGT